MRLRFTIRDLLWLTLAVALCTAWLIDHRQLRSSLDRDSVPKQRSPKLLPWVSHSFISPSFDGDPELPPSQTNMAQSP
jgi:hypothetical protein